MNISLAHIISDEIVNIIAVEADWEKIFSRDSGYYPVDELSGEIVIGATRSENGLFATLQVDEPSTPQLP
jgi:hypothetical protein